MSVDRRTVGVVHPGAMGVTVAANCRVPVWWASQGRSPATAARAEQASIRDAGTLASLVERCDVLVSVCPPAAAFEVATAIADAGFDGVYLDANAIAPATARRIATLFVRFVDGGIVGPPAIRAGTTRMYLSGDEAADLAELWTGSDLDARVIDGPAGAASALKMAYATWTKVTSALLLDVRALAAAEGVEDALLAEWALSQPDATQRSEATARAVAPKAWRFVGEMEQIARTFRDAGLPGDFADGAVEVYRRIAAGEGSGETAITAAIAAMLTAPPDV